MSERDERLQILNMLSEGRVTAEEAEELLAAIGENPDGSGGERTTGVADVVPPPPPGSPPRLERRRKRVRIIVRKDGDEKNVDVTVPLPLIRSIGRFVPGGMKGAMGDLGEGGSDVDIDAIMQAVESGAEGKLVDVRKGDARVEVWVVEE